MAWCPKAGTFSVIGVEDTSHKRWREFCPFSARTIALTGAGGGPLHIRPRTAMSYWTVVLTGLEVGPFSVGSTRNISEFKSRMIRSIMSLRLLALAAAFVSTSLTNQFAAAADRDDSDAATIQRYTGPPILLDEPEPAPPASLVEKRVDKDEFANGKLRYEREIARYSDDSFVSDGFYHEFYPSGEKFVEGQYKEATRKATGRITFRTARCSGP